MSVEIITKEDLQAFRLQLLCDLKALLQAETKLFKETPTWLRSREVRKILGISAGTLQNLRVTGVLRSSKVGKLDYYSQEDIEKLFKSNRKF